MLFNSLNYLQFFLIIFFVYWFVLKNSKKAQNVFILVSSYFFYGMWDWRFLFLIFTSSVTGYIVGILCDRYTREDVRKLLLATSLAVNLGILFVFKYFNFFNIQFVDFMSQIGIHINPVTIKLILPVGISFYTFQTLSYSIDVYRNKIDSTKSIIDFFAYVSFFPQLIAGPIERASSLLPQFQTKRLFNYDQALLGCKLILWGLFKKVVVADNCAIIVDHIFMSTDFAIVNPFWLVIGIVFFAFQIYGDFSGYSDMAIGSSKLLGFNLLINFKTPYFSRDIPEFWRRWHISLTSWFKDYLYIPLGGSRGKKSNAIRNVFIIFLFSGIWHGANWTFLIWGFFNAICFLAYFLNNKNRLHNDNVSEGKLFPKPKELCSILFTFFLICIGWVFFRSPSIDSSINYILAIFSGLFTTNIMEFSPLVLIQYLPLKNIPDFLNCIIAISLMIGIEWIGRENIHIVDFKLGARKAFLFYNFILFTVILLGQFNNKEFIYFQF